MIKIFKNSKDIVASEQEVEQFYRENEASYKTTEKVALQYLKLSREAIKSSLPKIDEGSLRDIYSANLATYSTPETRSIEYLLVRENNLSETKERTKIIDNIFDQATKGRSFSEIAQTIDDKMEIEIDSVENLNRGDLPVSLGDAVFALSDIGSVSNPINTEFGTHFVKLNGINPAVILPFDTVKAEIMKDELDRRADQVYVEQAELMAELAFENPDSLNVVSSTLEITPQETELVTKNQLVNEFRIPSVLKIFNDDVLDNNLLFL